MKISVIITTYNSAKNLLTSLPSVFAQVGLDTLFEFEIIAIDNCSEDNTLEVLKSFGVSNILQNEVNSGGPNRGRNRGLSIATGEVICFLDDDDQWHPTKTIEQLKFIPKAPIVTCGYLTKSVDGSPEFLRGIKHEEFTHYQSNTTFLSKLRRDRKAQNSYMSTIMISASLKHIRFEENFGSHDFDWLLRIFENNNSIQINRSLVTRFVHSENLSRTVSFRIVDYHFAMLTLENYAEKYPKACELSADRLNATRAKFHYEMGQMKHARRYFVKSKWELKNALYFITTFLGGDWVRRNYHVYG